MTASEELTCVCLNVRLDCSDEEADPKKYSGLLDSVPSAGKGLKSLRNCKVTYEWLVACSAKAKDVYLLRCCNCSTFLLAISAVDDHGLPLIPQEGSAVVAVSSDLLSQDAVNKQRNSSSYSEIFNVIIYQSADSPSGPASFASSSGTGIEKLNNTVAMTVSARREQHEKQIAALRKQYDDFTHQIHREAAALALKAGVQRGFGLKTDENEANMTWSPPVSPLARSFSNPTQSTPTRSELGLITPARASPRTASPGISLRRSSIHNQSLSSSFRNTFQGHKESPTLAAVSASVPAFQHDLDMASSLRVSEMDRLRQTSIDRMRQAAITKPIPATPEADDKAPPTAAPQVTSPGSGKRVTFADVDEAQEQQIDSQTEHVEELYMLDEQAATSPNTPSVGIAIEEQFDVTDMSTVVPRSPASIINPPVTPNPDDLSQKTQKSALKPGKVWPEQPDRPTSSRTTSLSSENKETMRRLRELLGTDAPSHREHVNRLAAINRKESPTNKFTDWRSGHLDPPEEEEEEDSTAPTADIARSLPIAIPSPPSRQLPFRQKSSVPQTETQSTQEPTSGSRRATSVSAAMRPLHMNRNSQIDESAVSAQLRDATLMAASLSMSMQAPSSLTMGSRKTSSGTPTKAISMRTRPNLNDSDMFSPPKNSPLRNRQLSSSLSVSIASRPEAFSASTTGVQGPGDDTALEGAALEEAAVIEEQNLYSAHNFVYDGEEPSTFVPPHLWQSLSRGGEGLLGTSVKDTL